MNYTIGHIAYFVSDLDRALAFYQDTLGFTPMFELHPEGDPISTRYLRIAPGQSIELFSCPGRPIQQHKDSSYVHLCLYVDDIQAARAEIVAKGVDATPIKKGFSKSWQFFMSDPDGNSIEVIQRTPDCFQTIYDHP